MLPHSPKQLQLKLQIKEGDNGYFLGYAKPT